MSGGAAVVCWRDFARQTQSLQLSVQFSTREMGRNGGGGVAGGDIFGSGGSRPMSTRITDFMRQSYLLRWSC